MKTRFVAAFAAVLFACAGGAAAYAAGATASPSPVPSAAPNPVPSLPPQGTIVNDAINALGNLVKSAYGWNDNEALGTVTYFHRYNMEVKLQLDRYREVRLHPGTVIFPRGWSIAPGQTVQVRGHSEANGTLDADVITVNPKV